MKIIEKIKWMVFDKVIDFKYVYPFMFVFYKSGNTKVYKGSCTVWRRTTDNKRCSTSKEVFLLKLYKESMQTKKT